MHADLRSGPEAPVRLRERRGDEHGRGRPAPRARGTVRRARRLAARGRAPTAGSPPSPSVDAGSSPASSSPTRSPSTRTSGSTSRTSAGACSCARPAGSRLLSRSRRTTSVTRWWADGEVNFADLGTQLSRERAGAQALGLDPLLRPRRVPRGDRAERSTWQRRRPAGSRPADDLELLAAPSLSVVCFRRRFGGLRDEEELGLPERRARRRARGERPRPRLLHALARPATRSASVSSATRRTRRRSTACWTSSSTPTSSRAPTPIDASSGIRGSPTPGLSSLPSTRPASAACRCSPRSRRMTPSGSRTPPGSARLPAARRSSASGRPRATST